MRFQERRNERRLERRQYVLVDCCRESRIRQWEWGKVQKARKGSGAEEKRGKKESKVRQRDGG